MIRIVNLRNYVAKENEVLVRVDRRSVVGNPFFMSHESMRNEVCDKYADYFKEQMKINSVFRAYIEDIVRKARQSDIALACWCFPKRCHAETIKAYVEKKIVNMKYSK